MPRRERTPRGYLQREMNPETYALRREVINYIYSAQKLAKTMLGIDIPRVTIRIVDADPTSVVKNDFLGMARMGKNQIWIPRETLVGPYKNYLKEIVYHEILHAVFGIDHDESCPLMSARLTDAPPLTDKVLNNCFINQIKKVI